MRLGYNTNGFAHHDLVSALEVLAQLGYTSVAITLDHGALNPYSKSYSQQLQAVRGRLIRYGMTSVVETGARYLLDPRVKHEPTLVSPTPGARERRIDFLCKAIDIASDLQSDCVSLWSGVVRDEAPAAAVWQRLESGLHRVLEHADRRGVTLGFEPEPGMFVDTMARFAELMERVPNARLQLTLDVGHLHCLGETPLENHIRTWGKNLVNVHLEDMCRGVHEHRMFGSGEIEFGPVFAAFHDIGYRQGLHVELSRHSHEAPDVAARAIEFLRPFVTSAS